MEESSQIDIWGCISWWLNWCETDGHKLEIWPLIPECAPKLELWDDRIVMNNIEYGWAGTTNKDRDMSLSRLPWHSLVRWAGKAYWLGPPFSSFYIHAGLTSLPPAIKWSTVLMDETKKINFNIHDSSDTSWCMIHWYSFGVVPIPEQHGVLISRPRGPNSTLQVFPVPVLLKRWAPLEMDTFHSFTVVEAPVKQQ